MASKWALGAVVLSGAVSVAATSCGGTSTQSDADASVAGQASCPVGAETCACYGDDTCNDNLRCLSGVCVSMAATGSGGNVGAGGSTGGNPGTGSQPGSAGDVPMTTTGGATSVSGGSSSTIGGSSGSFGGSPGSFGGSVPVAGAAGGTAVGSGGALLAGAAGTGVSDVGGAPTAGSAGVGGDAGSAGDDQGCDPDQWQCDDSGCIPLPQLCDGALDCSDGSDEAYCAAGGHAGRGSGGSGGSGTGGSGTGGSATGGSASGGDGPSGGSGPGTGATSGNGGIGGTGGVAMGGAGGDGSGGTGGTGTGGGVGIGGSDCVAEINNYPDLVNSSGWVGCDPDLETDNPAGFQGPFYTFGDRIACDPPAGSPCTTGSCCLSGATIVDETYLAWGCAIGFGFNTSADGLDPSPYSGGASCFHLTLTGSSGGNAVRIAFTQSLQDDISPYVELPPVAVRREATVCFSDASCPVWAEDFCQITGENYALHIMVMGAERDSTFTLCLESLIPS